MLLISLIIAVAFAQTSDPALTTITPVQQRQPTGDYNTNYVSGCTSKSGTFCFGLNKLISCMSSDKRTCLDGLHCFPSGAASARCEHPDCHATRGRYSLCLNPRTLIYCPGTPKRCDLGYVCLNIGRGYADCVPRRQKCYDGDSERVCQDTHTQLRCPQEKMTLCGDYATCIEGRGCVASSAPAATAIDPSLQTASTTTTTPDNTPDTTSAQYRYTGQNFQYMWDPVTQRTVLRPTTQTTQSTSASTSPAQKTVMVATVNGLVSMTPGSSSSSQVLTPQMMQAAQNAQPGLTTFNTGDGGTMQVSYTTSSSGSPANDNQSWTQDTSPSSSADTSSSDGYWA